MQAYLAARGVLVRLRPGSAAVDAEDVFQDNYLKLELGAWEYVAKLPASQWFRYFFRMAINQRHDVRAKASHSVSGETDRSGPGVLAGLAAPADAEPPELPSDWLGTASEIARESLNELVSGPGGDLTAALLLAAGWYDCDDSDEDRLRFIACFIDNTLTSACGLLRKQVAREIAATHGWSADSLNRRNCELRKKLKRIRARRHEVISQGKPYRSTGRAACPNDRERG